MADNAGKGRRGRVTAVLNMDYKIVKIVAPGVPGPSGTARTVNHSVLAITTLGGLVIFLSKAQPGLATSVAALRALVPDLGALTKKLEDPDTPEAERVVVNIDHDLMGIKDVWPGADVRLPHGKRPSGDDPPGDIARARLFVVGRAAVETAFRRINRNKLVAGAFVGTADEFDKTHQVASGLVNLQVQMRAKGAGRKGAGRKGAGRKGAGRKGAGRKGAGRKGAGRKGAGRKGAGRSSTSADARRG